MIAPRPFSLENEIERFVKYLKSCGGIVSREIFEDEYYPNGYRYMKELEAAGIIDIEDEYLVLTESAEEVF